MKLQILNRFSGAVLFEYENTKHAEEYMAALALIEKHAAHWMPAVEVKQTQEVTA
jgi:hypothetical protein